MVRSYATRNYSTMRKLRQARRSRKAGGSVVPAESEYGIVSTESKGIAQGQVDFQLTGMIGDHVQVALRVRGLIVDGRRKNAIADGQGAEDGLQCTSRSHHVARHGLRRRYRNGTGQASQGALDRPRFREIVQLGGSSMGIHVAHVSGGCAGGLQRLEHGRSAPLAVLVRGRDVEGIRRGSISGQLGVDG